MRSTNDGPWSWMRSSKASAPRDPNAASSKSRLRTTAWSTTQARSGSLSTRSWTAAQPLPSDVRVPAACSRRHQRRYRLAVRRSRSPSAPTTATRMPPPCARERVISRDWPPGWSPRGAPTANGETYKLRAAKRPPATIAARPVPRGRLYRAGTLRGHHLPAALCVPQPAYGGTLAIPGIEAVGLLVG